MAISSKFSIHVGISPPPILYIGRIWHEINANGQVLESWMWDGSRWISINSYEFPFEQATAALTSVANAPTFPVYPSHNILLLNLLITGIQSTLASATNNWSISLDRFSQPGIAATNITNLNTFSPIVFAANTITTVVHPINTLIDVAATGIKALRITEFRTGTSTKYLAYILQYKKVRP